MMVVGGLFAASSTNAQVRISAQININSQPDWGPSGYDYARYYYIPDADMYYDISSREYIYMNRGRWINTRVLPVAYQRYNFYNGYKVVINDRNPWLKHNQYKRMYSNNRNRGPQINWRDSRNSPRREVIRNDRNSNWDNGRNDRGRNDRRSNGHRH